jgi:hypothetical protein
MDSNSEAMLAQLRDIHAAAAPGWWPPAPGWWVVALCLLLALFYFGRLVVRRALVLRRRRRWLRALQALETAYDPAARPRDFLASLNRLFRAVAVRAFPATDCARLHGEEWVEFLRARLPESAGADALAALARGPYEPVPEFEAASLREQARAWVRRYG